MTLFINDRTVGTGRMDHTVPVRFSGHAGTGIGRDNGGVMDVTYDDRKPFVFTGTVKKVVFDLQPHFSAQSEQELHAAAPGPRGPRPVRLTDQNRPARRAVSQPGGSYRRRATAQPDRLARRASPPHERHQGRVASGKDRY